MGYNFNGSNASGEVGADFCQFLASFDWSGDKVDRHAELIRSNVALHVLTALCVVYDTEADNPAVRACLQRYILRFDVERPDEDGCFLVLGEWIRQESFIEIHLGRMPTQAEVGVMLMSVLMLCEAEVFAQEGV